MAAQAFGLYGHIRNNRIRSRFLIAGLFLLAYLTSFGLLLVGYGHGGVPRGEGAIGYAWGRFVLWIPFITALTALWVYLGFRINVSLIAAVTGARAISRADDPRLHRLLEPLCISRGLRVPKLAVIESDALNAFASGVNDEQFTVTVTSGLLAALDDAELEAVLAHELTHIRNGDVRLMVVAVVIAGVISFIGEVVFRGMARGGARARTSSSGGDRKGGGAAVLLGLAVILVAWLLAVVIRMSLSRTREYLADAGAVELTKNPDALISALLKIAGRADLDGVPSGLMDMCFENDPDDFADLFATHPSISKRIQALVEMAGGRVPELPPQPPAVGARAALPSVVEAVASRGPWGARPDAPPPV